MTTTVEPRFSPAAAMEYLPFALLTLPASQNPAAGTAIARRTAGEQTGEGTVTITGGVAQFGGTCATCGEPHLSAIRRAAELASIDGEYPVRWYRDHRALVEVDADGLGLMCSPELPEGALDALALAWIAAASTWQTGDPRAALRLVGDLYRAMPADRQAAIQASLADGSIDSGYLAAIFLHRQATETVEDERERIEGWFLGERLLDLPYDRRAVQKINDDESIDPDTKRLLIHDVILKFDWSMESANMQRIVKMVREQNRELIFGRLCRAFHNQSLLFANAGYIQIDDTLRATVSELVIACAGQPRLAPASDRLRMFLHGTKEAALTGAIGAVELLEDAILDDQRARVDAILQAGREGRQTPQDASVREIMTSADTLLALCDELRALLVAAPRRPAAYVFLSQRIFPLETYLLTRINEHQEPYLGKPDNLKMLVRSGGHRMYASPDYAWMEHADHWIEAIPLFIKERVLVVDGNEVTETVIDQAAMEETFREYFADRWAANIDNVMDSEHVALAREIIGMTDPRLAATDDRARAAAVAEHGLGEAVAAYAAIIAMGYRLHVECINQYAEKQNVLRYEALKAILSENIAQNHPQCLGAELQRRATAKGTTTGVEAILLLSEQEDAVKAEAQRLQAIADQPRRAVPALHVLTTQSARMSDNYVRTWIEESMAIGNVIRAYKLGDEVQQRITGYRTLIGSLGKKLIGELGMGAEVEEIMALENLPEAVAVARVVAGNQSISRQLSILAVLAEQTGVEAGTDPQLVEDLLASKADELQEQALRAVYARNDLELLPKMDAYRQANPAAGEMDAIKALILGHEDYVDDLAAFTRFAAREAAIAQLDAENPDLQLAAAVRDWLRVHSRLSLTTARRETLVAHDLHHLTLHPQYYYRAAGGNKRFHQLYTPSRVDLGSRERETVETWSQWVGGADRMASRVGRRVYGLINKNPKMFDSLTEPEVLKSGENASMVAHFSYSNAMSLLINSVGRGDVEEIGDQMSLRKDRFIHPGGEGYGGYCVPKDGLFLEFVLILTRATKLQQLGVPDNLHAGVVKFAFHLLAKKGEFDTEIAWEEWAMRAVAGREELKAFFGIREGDNGPIPVFQVTRLATALTQLGRPELTDSFDVLSNLAARWGIHKIIVGGEQVNRFMPFYKVWLTYKAMEKAKALNPTVKVREKDFVVVLSAEYKPDTQDGRYSVGMRKYELFAGTGEHLTYSLDTSGQDIAHLMLNGFESLWTNREEPRTKARLQRVLNELMVKADDRESIARLRALFPGYTAPAEIRMVSPMMLTTSDLLHYTSDTLLEPTALEIRRRLLNVGLTDEEIDANMQVYGPRLDRWTKLRDLPADQLERLQSRIGGDIHALALSIIGPAGNYEMSIQGADVVDTGIPNKDLLALIDDPVRLRQMMLEGNPNSALVIVDGASGARRRAMNRLAVMRWFAAAEAVGRNAVYACPGIGDGTIEVWREEMRHQRNRAQALYEALAAGDMAAAQSVYEGIQHDLRENQESALFLEAEERMIRFKKLTAQEQATARALAKATSGLSLADLDFGTWMALGGQFWLMGASEEQFAQVRVAFEQAIAALNGTAQADEAAVKALHCPQYIPAIEDFREEKGIESSNKATEEVAAVAIDTRKRLAERAARAKALRDRETAFKDALATYGALELPLEKLIAEARDVRGTGTGITQAQYGKFQALTRLSFSALGNLLFTDEPAYKAMLEQHLDALFTGRAFDMLALRAVVGGYEDPGDIARLAQKTAENLREGACDAATRDTQVALVADVAELFDCCRAIDLTIDFFTVAPEDNYAVWRAMADFFAESLNDHFYEYRPWAYSRGIGFAHLEGESLYELAVSHHQWLYGYLRGLVLQFTELSSWTAADVADLLGDMAIAETQSPIGADAATATERKWRCYNQLREIAFMRNDGFPLPPVFANFDPAHIDADHRTNLLYMFPIARTHVSRALMEGPTLAADLRAQGRPGTNLLISRDATMATVPGMSRPVLQIHNAHLYISREAFVQALVAQGASQADAEAKAAQLVGPKGIRIAARFSRPVTAALVFPFHGHPKYTSGLLEELGLPYGSQSLFHTWTTYDKAKYPAIFNPATGVEIPGEIDWLASYTAGMSEAEARQALEFGSDALGFAGLRAFAKRFRRVMVKDAAESGGRGQKAFTLRTSDGELDDAAIAEAVEFTYQISLKHNVAIQEIVISTPEAWATEDFMQSFVDRQIQDWGVAVNRKLRPRTSLYGSHRLIFSTSDPKSGNWSVSHPITLNSRQLITNVGRGGTLDLFMTEFIRPEFREQLWNRLVESGTKCMNALAAYESEAAQYEGETGRTVGKDATGLSYAFPRYMMLDFIVQPIFAEAGTLIDLEPVFDADGNRTGVKFILQQGEERFEGHVADWRVVLIEPNIGIGLWDRLALREQYYFVQAAQTPDWGKVGTNARIVLADLSQAGADYLAAIKA